MNFSALMSVVRRFPLGAVCTLLTIILSISAWVLRGQIVELDTVRREREKEGEAMLELLVGGSTQRQELAFVKEVAKRIDENIVVEDNLAEN